MDLCRALNERIGEILELWNAHMRGNERLESLPAAEQIDNLPELIAGLLDTSLCGKTDAAGRRHNVLAGIKHGSVRRRQGFPEEFLFVEFDALRRALWRVVRKVESDTERATNAILRIDLALTMGTHASMHGYFRQEIEATSDWEAEIQKLMDSGPFD